jgi:RNA polymerase sigma-70 factor (ECF subfamily)
MAKRLTRTKTKSAAAGIPYRVPPAHLLPERTSGVLAVLYLMFNEGYGASSGDDLIRVGLCEEAIRIAWALHELMPDEPEVSGLLALMVLQHARRAARVTDDGELVTLEHQDRSLWNASEIARAPPPAATDWEQIAALYSLLEARSPSPVIRLNRAVAVAMGGDLDAGLAIVEQLTTDSRLQSYYLLEATRADLLRRRGDLADAAAAYRQALALAPSQTERRYLSRRLSELAGE